MLKVEWNKTARESLQNIYDYISIQSPANAENVIDEIIEKANNLSVWPEKYQKEAVQAKNRNIRRAIIYSYKIIYEITPDAISILDVFSTYQNPDKLHDLLK